MRMQQQAGRFSQVKLSRPGSKQPTRQRCRPCRKAERKPNNGEGLLLLLLILVLVSEGADKSLVIMLIYILG